MARSPSKKPAPKKTTTKSAPKAAKPKTAEKPVVKPATSKVPPAVTKAPMTVAAKEPAKEPAKTGPAAKPVMVNESTSVMAGPELKKQELLHKVAELSGVKKQDAKLVLEAMLEVLGEALAEGRGMNLNPFGKLKQNRTKETPEARIVIAKIRQRKNSGTTGPGSKDTVAAAAE